MRILCEVFGLFDKRGASGGGTPYLIRGAWGLGAYKGAEERRLTGGRKYAPKGNGKDEKEKKERAKGKRKREKKRKGRKEDQKQAKRGWKEDGRRTHLCERHRKIVTRLPQNYTFVFNSKDVWRKHANLSAFT